MTITFTINGRRVASGREFSREIERTIHRQFDETIQASARRAGVKLRKTSRGFEAIGTPEAVEKFRKGLGRR